MARWETGLSGWGKGGGRQKFNIEKLVPLKMSPVTLNA